MRRFLTLWRAFCALLLALVLPWMGLWLQTEHTAVPAGVQAELPPRLVALTFDDGPRRSTTTQLLDELAQRGVKATFFLIGEQIPGNEDVVERMDSEGHQIGLHTYDHVWLTRLNAADFSAQVDRTRQVLKDIVGRGDFFLRPPYGGVDNGVKKRANCPIILWSVDPEDWDDKNVARIVAQVTEQAQDGDIILLHDIYPTSVQAAVEIIDALHAKGFLFVTVEELAQARHVDLLPGEVYRSFRP